MAAGQKRRMGGRIVTGAIALAALLCFLAWAVAHGPVRGGPALEDRLVIYSATDEQEALELLRAFRAAHPQVRLDYRSLRAAEVYRRFRAEADRGVAQADIILNSAMDLQIKLVNDGYAQPYVSVEREALPDWAVWKNEAYAVSSEPIVFGYNARLLPPALVPRTHDEFATALHSNADMLKARVGSYDPLRSPTGYLYVTQDIRIDSDSWDLIGALGRVRPRLFVSSKEMIDEIARGRLLLGYNLIGSYAFERAARDPDFRVVVPQDYVLMMSRVAIIARNAPHPNTARQFLDFMLSRDGQAILARHNMTPVRTDMPGGTAPFEGTTIRAVRVGPALMASIDRLTFDKFRDKWLAATSGRLDLTPTSDIAFEE